MDSFYNRCALKTSRKFAAEAGVEIPKGITSYDNRCSGGYELWADGKIIWRGDAEDSYDAKSQFIDSLLNAHNSKLAAHEEAIAENAHRYRQRKSSATARILNELHKAAIAINNIIDVHGVTHEEAIAIRDIRRPTTHKYPSRRMRSHARRIREERMNSREERMNSLITLAPHLSALVSADFEEKWHKYHTRWS